MANLGEQFLEKFGLKGADEFTQAVGCELLMLTAHNQYIKGEREEVLDLCFTPEIRKNVFLVNTLDLAGSWGNDLAGYFKEELTRKNIESPLNDDDMFKLIWMFLEENGYELQK